jgi:Zn-dependent M28 family amino/carboxypeptidase
MSFRPFAKRDRQHRSAPKFDGARAYESLERQCAFGPRNPGSPGHTRCLEYLGMTFERLAGAVQKQRFAYPSNRVAGLTLEGTNVIARFGLRKKRNRVLLCAHWDTRARADADPDPANHDTPVPGANDGASGVAVLIEMAELFSRLPPPVGVDIVLFDLEDQGDAGFYEKNQKSDPFCIGSEYYAARLDARTTSFGILLDMVGARNLRIGYEGHSHEYAESLVASVFDAAERVGASSFERVIRDPMVDDHLPFLRRGIPVVDLVDQDYAYWHTVSDTPEKCEARSLQQVGDVVTEVIYSAHRA